MRESADRVPTYAMYGWAWFGCGMWCLLCLESSAWLLVTRVCSHAPCCTCRRGVSAWVPATCTLNTILQRSRMASFPRHIQSYAVRLLISLYPFLTVPPLRGTATPHTLLRETSGACNLIIAPSPAFLPLCRGRLRLHVYVPRRRRPRRDRWPLRPGCAAGPQPGGGAGAGVCQPGRERGRWVVHAVSMLGKGRNVL